ncbi:hypothetical protein GCK72_008220 [Caenorhabditis remanei]|uniref:Uncharacterized protein n=1 Tax=Caenorhabditis remanei TaxID=31234 RepID=A0A6A5GZF9_CAERE|nr:hypothetical protein GCK72_008220 [Caenorhabditis remanei]KAF1759975.1 hypothetical protein GCK72_008220 [Caenorhabditis remanei]
MISGFDSNKKLCTVCNERPSYGYSYGAFVCNACKNFFRRIHIYKSQLITPIKPCLTGGRCKSMKKCRDCRNRRCLEVGMTPTSHELSVPEVKLVLPKIISKSKSDKEYTNTIQFLKELDRQRTKTFLTRLSIEDLSFDDLITSNSFNLIQRTTNFKPDFYDWATIDQITAIRFMKRFPFFEDLGTQEKKFFIQSSYVQFIILCNAMRTINLKSAEAIYPDNVDVFPVEIKKFYEFCPTKLNRIRCYLVHKLRELRLTPEEFLLLSAILICNPSKPSRGLGAFTCNACKMFFRRIQSTKQQMKECEGNCKTLRGCMYCRYQQCLNAGMKIQKPLGPQVVSIIKQLLYLDAHRINRFSAFVPTGDLSMLDLIFSDSVNYTKKMTRDYQPDYYDWSTMDQVCAVDMMKKFDFVHFLSKEEKRSFVRNSYIHIIILCLAMRSLESRSECFVYPGNVDVFPEEIHYMYKNCPTVLANVRCPLVARVRELRMTREEFVLLTAIMICNPGNEIFTNYNRHIINQYQRAYTSALVQYCLHTYQQFGPTRYTNILSLCDIINQTFKRFGNVWLSYMCEQKDGNVKKLYAEFLDLFME